MGLYDSFKDEVECPHCEQTVELAFQTKDLNKTMAQYVPGDVVKVGDNLEVSGNIEDLFANHSCRSGNKDEMLEKVELLRQTIKEEDYQDAKKLADEIKCNVWNPVSLQATAVIEDGVFQNLKDVRLHERYEE